MKRYITWFLLALLALPALADQHRVRVDFDFGFQGLYSAPSWVPVRLTVENLSQTIRGTLKVESGTTRRFGSAEGGYALEFPLSLAAAGRKSYSLVLPVQSGVQPVRLTITSDEQTVLQQEYALPQPLLDRSLLVTLSRGASLDFLLGNDAELDVVPAYPLIEYLPDRWIAYDGVGMVVIHDADLARLAGGQLDALERWVESGGTVLIAAGDHFGPVAAQRLSDLLPGAFQGNRTMRLSELGEAAGDAAVGREAGTGTVRYSSFSGPESAPALQVGELPVLWESPLGRGIIRVLTVDPRRLRELVPAGSPLWRRVFTPPADRSPALAAPVEVDRRPLEQPVVSALLQTRSYRYLPHWLVLLILVGYGGTMVVLLRVRPGWSPILATLGLLAVFFAAAPLLHPPGVSMYSLELFRSTWQHPVGRVEKDVVILGTRSTEHVVQPSSSSVIVPQRSGGTTVQGRNTLVARLRPWRLENYFLYGTFRLPLRLTYPVKESGDRVELHNNADYTFRNLIVSRGEKTHYIGHMEPDERVEAPLFPRGDSAAGVPPEDQALFRRAIEAQADGDDGGPWLVGWIPHELLPIRMRNEPDSSIRATLMVVKLPKGERNAAEDS